MRRDLATLAAEIRATLALAAPLAGANLAQMAMQVTNTVMVGHVGATALAAAGLGATLYSMLLMICQGVLTAVAPLAAHAIGADDHPAAGRIAGAGLILAAGFAVPVFALLSALPPLFTNLGYAPGLVIEIGRFLHAVRWGAPAFLGFAVLRFLLVAAFRARIVMIVPLVAVPANALIGWTLIFGHFGAPRLGAVGAGCATATVQWLMLGCYAGYMLCRRRQIPFRIAAAGFWRDVSRIMQLGAPIGVLTGLEIGLFATTGIMMGTFGADALGAHQLVFNVAGVTFMVPLGIGQAVTVRVAHRLGAGSPAAARRAAFVALSLGGLFMSACSIVLWTVPRPIAGLYFDLGNAANHGLVAMALHLFVIAAIVQVFDGTQVIAVGALRGYRDTAVPMVIAAAGYWAVGFAGGWLMAFPLGLGAIGLWYGLALGLAVVAIALTLRLNTRARAHLVAAPVLDRSPATAMVPP
jgi:multidrug resistance protein, MATE family